MTLLTVNSYRMFAYWDFDAVRIPDPAPAATLRFHDVTEGSPESSFDVPVDLAARNWYVPLWSPGRSYYVELGWDEGGKFRALARSNTMETPRAWPVTEVEPDRMGMSTASPRAPASITFSPEEESAAPRGDAAQLLLQKLEEIYAAHGTLSQPLSPEEPPAAAIPFEQAILPAADPPCIPAEETKEAGTPLAATPPVFRSEAAEALRRRLAEIHQLQGVQAEVMAAVIHPAAALTGPVPAPVQQQPAGDLTAYAEERFAPGFSSAFRKV